MKTGCIYRIIAPNGKSYVGQTVDFKDRMRRHKGLKEGCRLIKRAIKKYGWNKMKKTILAEDLQVRVELDSAEIYYIAYHNTFGDKGYNMTKGGGGAYGWKANKKQRANISARLMGNTHSLGMKFPPKSAEQRAEISARMMGNTNPLGKKHPPRTDKFRTFLSERKTKNWEDPVYREKCTAAQKGNTNAKGKRTPKQIENIRIGTEQGRRRKFIAKCFDNKIFLWD